MLPIQSSTRSIEEKRPIAAAGAAGWLMLAGRGRGARSAEHTVIRVRVDADARAHMSDLSDLRPRGARRCAFRRTTGMWWWYVV